MKFLLLQLQQRIDEKLSRMNELRPLPKSAVKKLRRQFQIEMTYNSNAIEGNSLTLKETFWVITEGITIKGKPLKDHLEAKDHYQALEFLYELVSRQHQPTLSEKLIRELHHLVMKKTDDDWAGRYRSGKVIIGGSDHLPPDAGVVPAKMKGAIDWFIKNRNRLHPVELAALIHHKLVNIHPFFDGNGRTARLVMNLLLLRQGYPLAIILKNDRKKYYRVLARADKGESQPLVTFISQSVERSLNIYLQALAPAGDKKTEKFLSLSEISKLVPYSQKYLNLLARQGKLEAHKQERNWVAALSAIEKYKKGRRRHRVIKKTNKLNC